jgi:hypothetical protein
MIIIVQAIFYFSIPFVLYYLFSRNQVKLVEKFKSVLPTDATKFEIRAWWSGFDSMKVKAFSLPTAGLVVFMCNDMDLYIDKEKITIAAKGPQHSTWGKKHLLRPLVIYRKETRTYSTIQFDALILRSEMIADDFIITFWNYSYNQEMKLHVKKHQKEIEEKLAELWGQ